MYFNNKEEVIKFLEDEKKVNPKTNRKIIINGKVYCNIMQEINKNYPELFSESNNCEPKNVEKKISYAKPLKIIDSNIINSSKFLNFENIYEYEGYLYQGPFINKTRLKLIKICICRYTKYVINFEILKDNNKNYWIKMKKMDGKCEIIDIEKQENADIIKDTIIMNECKIDNNKIYIFNENIMININDDDNDIIQMNQKNKYIYDQLCREIEEIKKMKNS
jgi:hypothetical protein